MFESNFQPITSVAYTPEMALAIRKAQKPFPFTMDIVDKGDHLGVRVYADEILNMPRAHRVKVMTYLEEIKSLLERLGAKVMLEGATNDGK